MKYVRTKDGIIDLSKITIGKDGWESVEEYIAFKQEDQLEQIKQADTIDELIDEKVLIEKDGHPTLLETVEFDRNIYLRINEYEFATQLPGNPIIHGSIWIYDSNGSPTLKPVAKMKSVLPNGEIDWELL